MKKTPLQEQIEKIIKENQPQREIEKDEAEKEFIDFNKSIERMLMATTDKNKTPNILQ